MKYLLIYLLSLLIISCDNDSNINNGNNNNTELPKPNKPISITLVKENNDSKNNQIKTGCEEAILPGC